MKLEGVAGTIAGSLKYHAVICPTQDPATTRGHQNSIIIGREEGLETAFMVLGAALPESLATISPMRRLHTMTICPELAMIAESALEEMWAGGGGAMQLQKIIRQIFFNNNCHF